MKLKFEIKPAEGGDDAKLLTKTLADMYMQYAVKNNCKVIDYSEIKSSIG